MSIEVRNVEPLGTAAHGCKIAVAPEAIPKGGIIIIDTALYANIGKDYENGQTEIYLWDALPALEVDAAALDFTAGEKVYVTVADLNDPVHKTDAAPANRFIGWVKKDTDLTGGAGKLVIEFNGRNL